MRSKRSSLTPLARNLRRDSTDAERWLWSKLRNRQIAALKFRRQVPVGKYIADFLCAEIGLIIELDGGQHNQATQHDSERSEALQALGFKILRFWNTQALEDGENVLAEIQRICVQLSPSPRQQLHALPYLGHPCPRQPSPRQRGEGDQKNSA